MKIRHRRNKYFENHDLHLVIKKNHNAWLNKDVEIITFLMQDIIFFAILKLII